MSEREALRERVEERLPGLSDDFLRALLEAMDAMDEPDLLDDELWGARPEPAAVADAVGRSAAASQRTRRAVLDDSLSRDEVAALLDVTPQAVSKQLAAGRLVGVRVGRGWRLPRWQLTEAGPVPGLGDVWRAFPGDAVALSRWAAAPHPLLDGRSPSEVLASREPGAVEQVIAAARAAAA